MKNLYLFLLAIAFLSSCNSSGTSSETDKNEAIPNEEMDITIDNTTEPNTLTPEEIQAGWILLFDGKSIDQWRGYNRESFPSKGWKVEDNMLWVIFSGSEEEGFGGDIITKEKFENFEFQLDFMLTDSANSGILYRVKEVANTPIWHNAPEYQILDDENYLSMGVTNAQLTGSNYDMHPAQNAKKVPMGEWNTAKIKVDGEHAEHWLNGVKVVDYYLESEEWDARYEKSKFKTYPDYGKTKSGHIGIQDHGHTVKFRNIKIRKL